MNSITTTGSSSGAGASGSRSFGSSGGGGDLCVTRAADNQVYVRADKIDLHNLDVQLEKTRSKVWLDQQRCASPQPHELLEWEIDLAKLDIQNQVASGTFGVVYRGTYDGNDVAVKVLDWGQEGQETTAKHRDAFEKEVAVWQKLDHPNVTKFVGASMGTSQLKIPATKVGAGAPSQRCCVVVVEYQHGGTLKTLLFNHRDKKLPYKKVVQLALDMARGLSYLHSKKIVHRDVKAENMLLDRKKSVKIADFGVARVEAQDDDNMTGQTGTLGYMAPEVLEGRPYDHKCDVYSFGVLLWETYCCAMAYPNYSIADISYHVVKLRRSHAWIDGVAGHPAGHPTVLPEGAVGHHGAVLGRKPGQQAGDGGGGGAAGEDRHRPGQGHDAGCPRPRRAGLLLLRLRQVAVCVSVAVLQSGVSTRNMRR